MEATEDSLLDTTLETGRYVYSYLYDFVTGSSAIEEEEAARQQQLLQQGQHGNNSFNSDDDEFFDIGASTHSSKYGNMNGGPSVYPQPASSTTTNTMNASSSMKKMSADGKVPPGSSPSSRNGNGNYEYDYKFRGNRGQGVEVSIQQQQDLTDESEKFMNAMESLGNLEFDYEDPTKRKPPPPQRGYGMPSSYLPNPSANNNTQLQSQQHGNNDVQHHQKVAHPSDTVVSSSAMTTNPVTAGLSPTAASPSKSPQPYNQLHNYGNHGSESSYEVAHGHPQEHAQAHTHGHGHGQHHFQHNHQAIQHHLPTAPPSPQRVSNTSLRSGASTKVVDNLGRDNSVTDFDLSEYMDPLQVSLSEISPDMLEKIGNPTIEDNTPAAAAIRANAEIKVGRMSKIARSVNAQSVRRLMKVATGRNNFGAVKGKPPRRPPSMYMTSGDAENMMYIVQEENSMNEFTDRDNVAFATTGMVAPPHTNSAVAGTSGGGGTDEDDDFKSCRSVDYSASSTPDGLGSASQRSTRSRVTFADDTKPPPPSRVIHKEMSTVTADVVKGTMEVGQKVSDHIDPHGVLRLKRKHKKKKRKSRNKSYVKGKVIDAQHERYMQAIAIMLGVRTSIANINALIHANVRTKILQHGDFTYAEKYEFRPTGSHKTPPHQLGHTFKFKDYSPVVFAYLRRLFGINEFDFLLSVCGNANFIEFISNAKSGQFFFYSNDGKYMIKTMTNAEAGFLRRILPHYFTHCKNNPNTLITKFLGFYRLKIYHLRKNVKFVIMNSVYYTDKSLQSFYDLKGSVTGRDAKPGEDVRKDNDLRRGLPETALTLPPNVRNRVRSQVVSDCQFLQKMGIMDYSMLVGIHHTPVQGSGRHLTGNNTRSNRNLLGRMGQPSRRRLHSGDVAGSNNSGELGIATSSVGTSYGSNMSDDHSSSRGEPSFRSRRVENMENIGPPNNIYDEILDEDDSSYLEGSDKRVSPHRSVHPPVYNEDAEKKKQQTIERIYWPFHVLYDIHGNRLMKCRKCNFCKRMLSRCVCHDGQDPNELGPYFKEGMPTFVPPLSDRKDGGFIMDTTGFDLPKKYVCKTSPRGDFTYDGKIIFMGIIDVLQEFNSRKVIEARYRSLSGEKYDASCVHPEVYAQRFVRFFDQYTQRDLALIAKQKQATEQRKEQNQTQTSAISTNLNQR